MKIKTSHRPMPIPVRNYDWMASQDNHYEPGHPIGYGPTEQEAIDDLLNKLGETGRTQYEVTQ